MTVYKNIAFYYNEQALSQGYRDFTACLAIREDAEKISDSLHKIINFGRYNTKKIAITDEIKNSLSILWEAIFDFDASNNMKNNFLMLVNQVKALLLYANNNDNGSFYHCMLKIIDESLSRLSSKVKF